MIGAPLNDWTCLGQVTEVAAAMARTGDPVLEEIAGRFGDTDELAAWIRSLPQRDDEGEPGDGPKVEACEPPQRLRIPADDPNCVERAALYVAAAELIDARPVRQLVTVDTPAGRHTFPVEDGEPVVLDPRVPRNALEGALFQIEGGVVAMTPREAVDWVTSIAEEPAARQRNGLGRVACARRALHGLIDGRPLERRHCGDVGWTLSLADREARRWGPRGHHVMRMTTRALDSIEVHGRRNRLQLRFGRVKIRPDFGTLWALARVGGRVGERVAAVAARAKLAELGITAPILREVERELNREGLSLGALSRPGPVPGSLGALTTSALAGRWLASKVL